MSHFLFIRHGETDWNKRGVMQGSNDIPLNQTGVEQAFGAAAYLKKFPIAKIVSSPQIRAKHTADIINQAFKVAVHVDHDLRERHFGDYEGRAWKDLPRVPLDPANPQGPSDYPLGRVELFHDVKNRTQQAVERWLADHDHEKDGLILFVAHGGVFGALNYGFGCDTATRIENAKPCEFRRDAAGQWACSPI